MKDLGKWQIISFISRAMAMVLGLVQSFVIIRLLSVSEWGIVQLATSIGGALGIYQHLGLASASTREISSAKDDSEVFKIFITSAVIRYMVTFPIAIGLFIFANHLAVNLYKNELLVLPLKIYAITLLFQGFQSILNSVVQGTKRFKQLFIYQVGIAFASVALFIPFVLFYKINGYFYAFLAFNAVNTFSLFFLAFKPLKGKLKYPSGKDFKRLFKEIFSISIAIYLVKILYTNWEKMGSNVLGLFNSPEVVAIFAFALLYAKKLMSISDSVTDVSLPVLSEKYTNNIDDFKKTFSKNFDKIFCIVIFVGSFASFWAREISYVLIGSDKYNASFPLIAPMIVAFILYSYINIIKSSVLIPAKMIRDMIISFVLLLVGTGLFFFAASKFIPILTAMAWGTAFGGLVALLYMTFMINVKIKLPILNIDHVVIFIQAIAIALMVTIDNFWIKIATFPFFAVLLLWGFFISGFVQKADFIYVLDKFNKIKKKFA
jgi:O-antigen/teichoic acid export membrane protein